jgi:proteasome lid subunit RPN8/RPN11
METVPEISSALLVNLMRLVRVGSSHDGVLGPPDEKCGVLRGRGHRVLRADAAANVAADPFKTFEIDPAALIAAHRAARRQGGLELLGYYHTHPTGDAWPSKTDAACAAPDGKLWLIAAQGEALLFRAVESGAIHGRFDQLLFDLVVGKQAPERVGGVTRR